jgi:hypothetical protein
MLGIRCVCGRRLCLLLVLLEELVVDELPQDREEQALCVLGWRCGVFVGVCKCICPFLCIGGVVCLVCVCLGYGQRGV